MIGKNIVSTLKIEGTEYKIVEGQHSNYVYVARKAGKGHAMIKDYCDDVVFATLLAMVKEAGLVQTETEEFKL